MHHPAPGDYAYAARLATDTEYLPEQEVESSGFVNGALCVKINSKRQHTGSNTAACITDFPLQNMRIANLTPQRNTT
jgi:hypothetical protein